MYKHLACIVFLVVISWPAFSQKEVLLKVEYKPETTYKSETKISTYGKMDIKGDRKTIKKVKESGVKFPMILEGAQLMRILTTTGVKNDSDEMPITIIYEKGSTIQKLNGQESVNENPLANTKIEGRINSNGQIKIDSIYGGIKPELKKMIFQLMENIQKQIAFPTKPLKIGGSFNQETPLTIPIAGMAPMKIVIKMKYTLRKIENDKAFFDLLQNVTLDFSVNQTNANATGKGNGNVTFDLNSNFITLTESDTDMNLIMAIDKVTIKAKMHTKSIQSVIIE